jgi:hypothetical protein
MVVVMVDMGVVAAVVGDPHCSCSYKLQVTNYKLQVKTYKLQVKSYKLQVKSYK